MIRNLFIIFIILSSGGCISSKKTVIADALNAFPAVNGSVVNSTFFIKGGTLALASFEPGVGAAANDETDQLSAMLIKGIKDTLPQEAPRFSIAVNGRKDTDLYLDGYIDDYGRDKRFNHLNLQRGQAHLAVSGEIWLRETGEKVFLFQSAQVINLKAQDPKTAAYQMGVAIARFIGSR